MNYLNIPGLYNSGDMHWQSRWERLYPGNFTRVQQSNWTTPSKEEWVATINEYIRNIEVPTVLVAHSLGCMATVHWATEHYSPFIKGALLVAPADVERSTKPHSQSFSPVPLEQLAIPTIVVASMDDPCCAIERAARWAAYWRSRFVSVGNAGHINGDSNLHDWSEGISLLQELETSIGIRQYRYAC